MPTYTFKNKETEEEFEKFMKNSEREEFLKNNPDIEQTYRYAPSVGYDDSHKPDDGFRDILRKVKKDHPGSDVNTF